MAVRVDRRAAEITALQGALSLLAAGRVDRRTAEIAALQGALSLLAAVPVDYPAKSTVSFRVSLYVHQT